MDAMTLVSIETTQAIQTFPHTVKLVAYKRTVVRVTVRHNFGTAAAPKAVARLRVISQSGGASPWFDPANGGTPLSHNPGHALVLKSAPDREVTDDSFNFYVPLGWCAGTVQWEFECRVDEKSLPPALRKNQLRLVQRSPPITFRSRRRLELRYVRVLWPIAKANGTTVNSLPSREQCGDALMRASQLLPTPPPLIASALDTTMVIDLTKEPHAVWDLWNRLGMFRDAVDPATGAVKTPVNSGIWCGIYDFSDYGIRGLTGNGSSELVADVQRIPIAHEVGHCLHQDHLEAQCPLAGPIAGAELEQTFAGGAKITDVPFDVLGNQVVAKPPGQDRWDLMTYCIGANWVSVERWRRLWDEIGTN